MIDIQLANHPGDVGPVTAEFAENQAAMPRGLVEHVSTDVGRLQRA